MCKRENQTIFKINSLYVSHENQTVFFKLIAYTLARKSNSFLKQKLMRKRENQTIFQINSLHVSLKINQFSKTETYV